MADEGLIFVNLEEFWESLIFDMRENLEIGIWNTESGPCKLEDGDPESNIWGGSRQYPEYRAAVSQIPRGTSGPNISAPGPKAPEACRNLWFVVFVVVLLLNLVCLSG